MFRPSSPRPAPSPRNAGEAFSQQRICRRSAGAVAPDFPRLREVDDVFLLVARPRDILRVLGQWGADGVDARDDALEVLIDQLKTLTPMRAMIRMFTTT